MDVTIPDLAGLGGLIASALTFVKGYRESHNQKREKALSTLYTALDQTTRYVRLIPKTGPNPKTEENLAHLWSVAGITLKGVDDDLSRRCMFKGEYWHNPEAWTVGQLREFRIRLEEVNAYARQLTAGV